MNKLNVTGPLQFMLNSKFILSKQDIIDESETI